MSPPAHRLDHVTEWVFDLDNTLYPAECDLFAQIDVRMTDFVSRELSLDREAARALQKQYYAEHGTTLNGLMTVHGLKPAAFLDYVHDIDLSPIDESPELAAAIAALPGRKYVYTNGSRGHAERVSARLGIGQLLDGIYGIECAGYLPKPHRGAFDLFVATHDVDPRKGAFFEDLARNLAPAHEMGFATVLVRSGKDWSHEPEHARPAGPGDDRPAHVDYETDNLTQFLRSILAI